MDEDFKREIALFRFSLIALILKKTYTNETVKDYLQEICSKKYDSPIGLKKEYLRQRIMVNYHFEGLGSNEVKDYIVSRLSVAG